MRKVFLSLAALLISANVMASSETITSAVINGVQTHASNNSAATAFPLVYGGQDISRSLIATADEPLSIGQQTLVG